MMTDEALVTGHYRQILPGRDAVVWEWEGLRGWPLRIERGCLEDMLGHCLHEGSSWLEISDCPKTLNCFPWPLRFVAIERRFDRDELIYVRTDSGFWLYWYCRFRALPFLQMLRTRIILTLMVWNLAHIEPGEIANWRCVGRKRR